MTLSGDSPSFLSFTNIYGVSAQCQTVRASTVTKIKETRVNRVVVGSRPACVFHVPSPVTFEQ